MRLSILSRLRETNASTKKRRNTELEDQDEKGEATHKYRNIENFVEINDF